MKSRLTRRKMLSGAAAAGGAVFAPQVASGQAQAGAQSAQGGRRFRAFVRHGTGTSIEEMRLLPIQPREVVVRSQASAVCYTITGQVLGTNNAQRWQIPNHS